MNILKQIGRSVEKRCSDTAFALFIFFLGLLVAFSYCNTFQGKADFYQKYMGAALMVALGEGYQNPDIFGEPVLKEFFYGERLALQPVDLPEEIPLLALSDHQRVHRYPLYCIGLIWRIFGIHWYAVWTLCAILFAAALVCSYGLLRLGMGRIIAMPITILLLFSPITLYVLPHFRDFSKAPFFLAALWAMGALLKARQCSWPRLLSLSATLGAAIGVGIGFRQDLLIVYPIAIVLLACFFRPAGYRGMAQRIVLLLVLNLALLFTGFPILKAMQAGDGKSSHTIVLGLNTAYTHDLRLDGAPYEWMPHFKDEYAHTSLSAYGAWKTEAWNRLKYPSLEYNQMGKDYLKDWIYIFPADFLLRWFSATRGVMEHDPFAIQGYAAQWYYQSDLVKRCLQARREVFGRLSPWGTILGCAVIFLLGLSSLRYALAVSCIWIYFTGYSSLVFHLRHRFHLEIFFWWALGFLIWQTLRALYWIAEPKHLALLGRLLGKPRACPTLPLKRLAVFLALLSLSLTALFGLSFYWQRSQVQALYAAYEQAPRSPLPMKRLENATNKTFLLLPENFLPEENVTQKEKELSVQSAVLVIEAQVDDTPYPLDLVYKASSSYNNFSHRMIVPARRDPSEKTVRLFCPIFNTTGNYWGGEERRFMGVVAAAEDQARVLHFYQLDKPGDLPFICPLTLCDPIEAMPWRLSHRPALTPRYLRSQAASTNTLIPQGNFENWDETQAAPASCHPPQPSLSTITSVPSPDKGNPNAVLQQWRSGDLKAPIAHRFSLRADQLVGQQDYSFFCWATNPSDHPAQLDLYLLEKNDEASSRYTAPLCTIPPHSARQEYHASFHLPELKEGDAVLVVSGAPEAGTRIRWENWRLDKAPTPLFHYLED